MTVWPPLLAALALLAATRADPNPDKTCNLELLNSFKLAGMPYPSTEKLEICLNVELNCCTMADELAIVKYWRDYTSPKVYKFANLLAGIYHRLFNFQRYVTQVDFSNILVHYTERAWFPFKQDVCTRFEGDRSTKLWDTEAVYEQWKKTQPAEPAAARELHVYQNMSRRKEFVDSLKPEVVATLKNAGSIRQKFDEAVEGAAKKLASDVSKQTAELRRLSRKLARKFKADSANKIAENVKVFLERREKDIGSLQGKSEEEQKEFLKEARGLLDTAPEQVAEEGREFQRFFEMVRKHLTLTRKAQRAALRAARWIQVKGKGGVASKVRGVVASDLPSIYSFYAPEFERNVERFPPIRQSVLECKPHDREAYRTFLQINRPKYEHCFKIHQNMRLIDQMEFDDLVVGLRDTIVRVLDVKKTLYCAVCDADLQQFFDYDHGVIKLDTEFCRDLVGTYRDYIEFANVVMVQFGEQLLQYIHCINSLPQEIAVPFVTRFEFHKRNIFFFKRCFDHISSDDFMRYCHFICSTFNFDTFSKLIDGDLLLMYHVYMEIVDFTRSNNIPFDTSLVVEDDFLRTLGHPFYPKPAGWADAKEKAQKLTTREVQEALEETYAKNADNYNVGRSAFNVNMTRSVPVNGNDVRVSESEVFDRVKKVYSPRNMRYLFFPDAQGMNPLSLVSGTYMQLELDNFVTDYYKRITKNRALSSSTIKGFFNIKGREIVSFNRDLDLTYNASLTHKPPEVAVLSISDLYRNVSKAEDQRSEREEEPAKVIF